MIVSVLYLNFVKNERKNTLILSRMLKRTALSEFFCRIGHNFVNLVEKNGLSLSKRFLIYDINVHIATNVRNFFLVQTTI